MNALIGYRFVFFIVVVSVLIVSQACQQQSGKTPIVALGPEEGTVRWARP